MATIVSADSGEQTFPSTYVVPVTSAGFSDSSVGLEFTGGVAIVLDTTQQINAKTKKHFMVQTIKFD